MSDQQQETTIDDVWINRLAMKLGILTAQNERLMIENEALQQRIDQMQSQVPDALPPEFATLNGESR